MNDEEKKYQQAKARVARIRSFYSSVIAYIITNIILIVVNLVFMPGDLWFWWVSAIWGIVLIIQGLNTFTVRDRFLGDEWEKRKIDEILNKDKKSDPDSK